jgi:microcystin degradation protein MlrC
MPTSANAGLSAVVVTDGDPSARAAGATSCSTWPGQRAPAVRLPLEPLADSLARAQQLRAGLPPGAGPVVLLDHSDNCASGGTMDTMTVLAASSTPGSTTSPPSPSATPGGAAMMHAGIGAECTLSLGGKLDMPAIGLKGEPLHGDAAA